MDSSGGIVASKTTMLMMATGVDVINKSYSGIATFW